MVAELNEYKINKGLTDNQINQLISYSISDPELKYTSDAKRFKDRDGYEEFSTHILAYYALVDDADNLLGIIWFDDTDLYLNQQNPSEFGISFAIRLYGEARGKGLAMPFSKKVMEDFKQSEAYKNHPHSKFWLSVSPENQAAVNLYRKLGFKDLEIEKTHNKLLMVLED